MCLQEEEHIPILQTLAGMHTCCDSSVQTRINLVANVVLNLNDYQILILSAVEYLTQRWLHHTPLYSGTIWVEFQNQKLEFLQNLGNLNPGRMVR
jgi:hypothetical protein